MNPKPILIRGITLAAPRPLADVDAGPEWMSAPDRQCAPVAGEIAEAFTSDDRYARRDAAKLCVRHCPYRWPCRDAAKLCVRHCPYRWPCLERAVNKSERHGVWGGLDFDSEVDRNKAHAQVEERRAAEEAVTADVERYQHEITWLISRCRTNAQIARGLHITENRVALIRERLDQRTAVAA